MKSVKVNATELLDSIERLDDLINSFEDIELSLNSKVLSLKDIWNDGNTLSFYESVEKEKQDFNILIQDLRKFKNIYNYVYRIISKYGNKIQVDFNHSNTTLSKYNSCNQKLYTIDNLYNNLDLRRCYEVANEIQSQKIRFRNAQRDLDRYMDKYNKTIDSLTDMEYEVNSKIYDLDLYGIESINYKQLPSIDPNTRLVGMTSDEDIETALNNISIDIQAEEDIITSINNEFINMRDYYISNMNSKTINNKQIDFNCEFKKLKNNHEDMVIYINSLKEDYLNFTRLVASNTSKDIKG